MARIIDIPNELVVAFGTVNAVTAIGVSGSYPGQQYYQHGEAGQGFRRNIWTWTGTEWWCMPVTPILGTGNPNGIVTPDAITQQFLATDTGLFYVATGITNNDWKLTN